MYIVCFCCGSGAGVDEGYRVESRKNSKMLIISLVCLTNTFSVGGSTDLNFTNDGIPAISGAKTNAIAPNSPCRSMDL